VPIPIIALALSAFAIGTTEFVIMGLLPDVAQSLNVSVPRAGMLITGYALGVALGSPILSLATNWVSRKRALEILMGIFIIGNILCALASSYTMLMLARVFTSFAHGSFFGIGAVVAASLVPDAKRAGAIALMFTGLALANVLGVPLGTFIGQTMGWRTTFVVVAGLGVASIFAVILLVPMDGDHLRQDLRRELRVFESLRVWLALLTTILGFGGVFVVFTYIAPILEQVTGFSPQAVAPILVLFGVGLAIGNVLGGKIADRSVRFALVIIFIALVIVMLTFSVTMHSRWPSIVTIFVWGIAAFATIPGLQTNVLTEASDAPNLASTLNIGAFNLGNALGAWLGGLLLEHQYGLDRLPIVAAVMAAGALIVTVLASKVHNGTSLPLSAN
jgi:DHA1 family inner membrane transport protein